MGVTDICSCGHTRENHQDQRCWGYTCVRAVGGGCLFCTCSAFDGKKVAEYRPPQKWAKTMPAMTPLRDKASLPGGPTLTNAAGEQLEEDDIPF